MRKLASQASFNFYPAVTRTHPSACAQAAEVRRRQQAAADTSSGADRAYAESAAEEKEGLRWQARCGVLSALATYLHAAPGVQRAAVRRWEPVAALFGLLWDGATRRIALSMVRLIWRVLGGCTHNPPGWLSAILTCSAIHPTVPLSIPRLHCMRVLQLRLCCSGRERSMCPACINLCWTCSGCKGCTCQHRL